MKSLQSVTQYWTKTDCDEESDMHPDMYRNSNIEVIGIPRPPKFLQTDNKSLFLVTAPLKVVWQVASLYYVLGYGSRASRWMIVQNPPSIPTLAVATFISFFRNTRLVIDWHNFGYSILALKLGNAHPLVKISKQYELFFGGLASAHFTVTNAMGRVLRNQHGIPAVPLHDRPPAHFQPLTNRERVFTLKALEETRSESLSIIDNSTRLLVSATSWTADEDFSILLRALTAYAAQRRQNAKLPRILAVITGKGPQKADYLDRIRALQNEGKLEGVTIKTAWLSMTDYAALLGAADLGISLHTSSSGVDLPMKVVDMFGTGLPVLGCKFEAWSELVFEGINGRGFGNYNELKDLLIEVLENGGKKLQVLRAGALKECDVRWDAVWDRTAGRMFGLVK